MMERLLHHHLDFKLVFTTLSGGTGRVMLDTLMKYWSERAIGNPYLPKDCVVYWKAAASQDGSLTLERFVRGFQEAMKADASRLCQLSTRSSQDTVQTHEDNVRIHTSELEDLLSQCNHQKLTAALGKSRKELYMSQKSVDTFMSTRRDDNDRKSGKAHRRSSSFAGKGGKIIDERETLMQVEELLRGRLLERGQRDVSNTVVAEVMGQLTSILHLPTTQEIPSSHPYATIRRHKPNSTSTSTSTKQGAQLVVDTSSQHRPNRPGQSGHTPMLKVDRSLSIPVPRQHVEQPTGTGRNRGNDKKPLPLYSTTTSEGHHTTTKISHSMHNLDSHVLDKGEKPTRHMLNAWRDNKIANVQRSKSLDSKAVYNQYFSSPDVSHSLTPLTPTQMKQVEQYGTLRKESKKSKPRVKSSETIHQV